MTRRGERLAHGLADAFAAASIPALVQGVGPMLQVLPLRAGHEDTEAIHDMRDFCAHADPVLYRRFVHELFGLGVYASPALLLHMIVSTAHTDADIDAAVEAATHRGGPPVSRPTIGITSYWTQAAMSHWSCDAVLVSQGYVEGVRVAGGRPGRAPGRHDLDRRARRRARHRRRPARRRRQRHRPDALRPGAARGDRRAQPAPRRRRARARAPGGRARRPAPRHLPRRPGAERRAGRHARPAPGRHDRRQPAPPVRLGVRDPRGRRPCPARSRRG